MKKIFTGENKIWKVMKIYAAQGIIAMVMVGMSMAHDNRAQLLDTEVTLRLKDVTLEQALNQIEAITSVQFVYSVDQLNANELVSLVANGISLREILDTLLNQRHIKYTVHEKESSITLRRLKVIADEEVSRLTTTKVKIELITVSGKVTDAKQQPMAGVNVVIKGTTTGTTTDSEGRFTITADDKDILIFSFIGYSSIEIKVDGRSIIDANLLEDITKLGEVVINAGYWNVTDKERTGNIGRLTSKEIQDQPVSNSIATLQARMPGLQVTQSTGVPGGNFRVRIRGTNSIANGNDPLYIIDGVPFVSSAISFLETSGDILGNPNPAAAQGGSPLNSINPADIESIEVLKDAAATAIYGSRGSNGVILITTKKGQAGGTKVDFNMYMGVSRVGREMDLLTTSEYVQMRKEGLANDNLTPTVANARDLVAWDTTRYTNWQKELLGGTAHSTDAQVNVSGGDTNTQFTFGGGYHRETTVFPGDNSDQRVSSHLSVTNKSANEKFKTSVTVNYAVNRTNLFRRDLTSQALFLAPNAPALYDENGNLSWVNWNSALENPLAILQRRYEATVNNFIGNVVTSYSILPNLDVKANLGYTSTMNDATLIIPRSSLDPAIGSIAQNQTNFSNSSFQNWIAEPQGNWRPKLAEGHFNILIGTTFLDQSSKGLAQTTIGFPSEALMKNLASAQTRILGTNYYSKYRYCAAFSRLNYIHRGKYIIDLTGRRDGSSRFGPGKQFANFGAVGAAWLFSEEGFIKDYLPVLSFGKLRTSYGITGNDQLGDYQYMDTYRSSSAAYQTTTGLTPVRLSNPDFGWETNKKFEAGIESGIINNRILSAISFYQNRSSNQLVGYPLPPTAGFANIQGNFPATVQNRGFEIEIKTRNIEKEDFSWLTAFNITVPRNVLLEFPNLASSPSYANTYVIGEPLSIRKGYQFNGVSPTSGFYTFEDVNKDNVLDLKDRAVSKFVGQDLFGGLLNSFSYRGFQCDLLFQFVKQTGLDFSFLYTLPGILSNQPAGVMERWTKPGDDTHIQRFGATNASFAPYSQRITSEEIVVDASFIRLKNASLSYTIPANVSGKWHASSTRIFILGQNLMTMTRYKGLDPENQNTLLPPLKVLTIGISITF